jgi:hypothetical protein
MRYGAWRRAPVALRALTWPDLVIDPELVGDLSPWLQPWSGLVGGHSSARFLSRFGCWFLEERSGAIQMLDVFYGELTEVAASRAELERFTSNGSWREVYLLSRFVSDLHQDGKIASGTNCYVLAPPPLAGGPDPWGSEPLSTKSAMVVDVEVLQVTYAQVVRHARELGPS